MMKTKLISTLMSASIHGGVLAFAALNLPEGTIQDQVQAYSMVFENPAPKAHLMKPKSKPIAIPKKAKTRKITAKTAHTPQPPEPALGTTREALFTHSTLHNELPKYPLIARKSAHEGCVKVEVHISEKGTVLAADIHQSSDHWELDQVAVAAVKDWLFLPALDNDVPKGSHLIISFNFKLSGIQVI